MPKRLRFMRVQAGPCPNERCDMARCNVLRTIRPGGRGPNRNIQVRRCVVTDLVTNVSTYPFLLLRHILQALQSTCTERAISILLATLPHPTSVSSSTVSWPERLSIIRLEIRPRLCITSSSGEAILCRLARTLLSCGMDILGANRLIYYLITSSIHCKMSSAFCHTRES